MFFQDQFYQLDQITQSNPFFTLDQIYRDIQNMLTDLQQKFLMDQDTLLILLHKNKWKKQVLQQKLIDNTQKYIKMYGLCQIAIQSGNICNICLQINTQKFMICHPFCKRCMQNHFQSSLLNHNSFCQCPELQCKRLLGPNSALKIGGIKLARKMKKVICQQFIRDNNKIVACTRSDCQFFIKLQESFVTCRCGFSYCSNCKSQDHRPAICKDSKQWLKLLQWQSPNINWMMINTKPCPQCSSFTQKQGECNFMTCFICKYKYCWNCKDPWNQHSSFKCNKFNETKQKHKQQYAINKKRTNIERFVFYKQRYDAQQTSQKYCLLLFPKLQKNVEFLLSKYKSDLTQHQYLLQSCSTVLQGRKAMKWSYCKAYFCPSQKKDLFQWHQGIFQLQLQNLQGALQDKLESLQWDQLKEHKLKVLKLEGHLLKFMKQFN